MTKGFFITGTDTGIGKTYIAACVLRELSSLGYKVAPFKPVASGVEHGHADNDIDLLSRVSAFTGSSKQICPYQFEEAIAPHIAANRQSKLIDMSTIQSSFKRLAADYDVIIAEGSGGWRVPISSDQDIKTLGLSLNLPTIVVVGVRLGCINHALLTLDAVVDSGLPVAGWIANELAPRNSEYFEMIEAIRVRSQAPLIGECEHAQNRINWISEFNLEKFLKLPE